MANLLPGTRVSLNEENVTQKIAELVTKNYTLVHKKTSLCLISLNCLDGLIDITVLKEF